MITHRILMEPQHVMPLLLQRFHLHLSKPRILAQTFLKFS
jgi:hypothetical protein